MDLNRGKEHPRRACHSYQGIHGVWKPWRPRKIFTVSSMGVFVLKGRDKFASRLMGGFYPCHWGVCLHLCAFCSFGKYREFAVVYVGNSNVPFLDRLDFFFLVLVSPSSTVLQDPRTIPFLHPLFLEFKSRSMKTNLREARKAQGAQRGCWEWTASQMFFSVTKGAQAHGHLRKCLSFKDNICMEMVARGMQCDGCYVNPFPSP